jgi:hypothetical protein
LGVLLQPQRQITIISDIICRISYYPQKLSPGRQIANPRPTITTSI